MSQFKAIATITWIFNSEDSPKKCLDYAKSKFDEIINCKPEGPDFESFSIQMDLAKMKDRKKLIHLAVFEIDQILKEVSQDDIKKEWIIEGKSYFVRMNSDRYHLFKINNYCVSCGIQGTEMILDINPCDQNPHFNLYAKEHGRLVLMTKDHIQPKSKGGLDELNNYQLMCSICNNLKGADNLSLEDCRYLRNLSKNEEKLPKKELKELINKKREELISQKEYYE